MTAHDNQVGTGRHNGTVPEEGHAPTDQDARQTNPRQPDHVERLEAAIATALKQRSRTEPVVVSRIQQRAELYEKAYVQARQAAIDAVAQDASPVDRITRQAEALRKPEFEVLVPDTVVKLAALDARQYTKLRDPEHRAAAAQAMTDLARLSTGYRAALATTSAEVSGLVESAIAAAGTAGQGAPVPAAGDKPAVPRDQTAARARGPAMTLEPQALERVAARRASDLRTVAEQLGLNSIEQAVEQKREARRAQSEEKSTSFAGTGMGRPKAAPARPSANNLLSSDEVFTAVNSDVKPIVPAEVEERYLRVGSKFYHPRYTLVVAFEDKGNKLETRSNSEQIAGAMMAIARARGWDEIKVAGSETFRKEVWLEAAAHGMHVKGYSPSDVDKAELAKRIRHVEADRMAPDTGPPGRGRHVGTAPPLSVKPAPVDQTKTAQSDQAGERQPGVEDRQRARAFAQRDSTDAVADHPELAGAYAARASIARKVAADGLSPRQRAVVMARVEANLVNSIERGQLPEVKIRDQAEVRHEKAAGRK